MRCILYLLAAVKKQPEQSCGFLSPPPPLTTKLLVSMVYTLYTLYIFLFQSHLDSFVLRLYVWHLWLIICVYLTVMTVISLQIFFLWTETPMPHTSTWIKRKLISTDMNNTFIKKLWSSKQKHTHTHAHANTHTSTCTHYLKRGVFLKSKTPSPTSMT